jgi:hypothetical protein
MDLLELGIGDVDWIGLPQDGNRWRALVNSVMNLRVPRTAGKLYIYIFIYVFITECNWAYARWQFYINNETIRKQ